MARAWRHLLPALAFGLLLPMVVPASAQGPADDVKAAIDELVAASLDGDEAALEGLLYELYVSCADPEGQVTNRAETIEQVVAAGGMPLEVDMGEYEPELHGNVALAVVPMDVTIQGAVTLDCTMVAVLILLDGDWTVLADCTIIDPEVIEPFLVGAQKEEFRTATAGAQDAFEDFMDEIVQSGTDGDAEAFFGLCDPEGAMGGPYGPNGLVVVAKTADVIQMAAGQPGLTIVAHEEPDEITIVGCAVAFMAANTMVTFGDGDPSPQRSMTIAYWSAEDEAWRILFSLDAPLGE